ncbi:hypothetical protein ACOJQI_20705 [Bacillus salacetis]|uniref:hypothetical protein n=1 Tax=Bacillus salacetis TaxID=2315464 RepID=UPI003B9F079E
MLYNLVLFLHIIGTVIMFIAVGMTLTAMVAMLHTKNNESLREWSSLAVKLDGLLPFSVILVLFPGLYLVFSTWGWEKAWVNFSLAALILMTVMGPIINLPRLKLILKTVNEERGSIPSAEIRAKVMDRTLWNSVLIMTMLLVGILFLMTVKTGMIGSVVTLAATAFLGIFAANLLLKRAVAIGSKKTAA